MIVIAWSFGALRPVVEALVILSGSREDGVVGVCLDMFFQILRTLEALAAELTLVRLERNMDSDVGGDVVTLDSSRAARIPLAGKVQVVGALAANMSFTYVFIKRFRAGKLLVARIPTTGQIVLASVVQRRVGGCT